MESDVAESDLDPRIQVELENLNKATDEINKLEIELDVSKQAFASSCNSNISGSKHCFSDVIKRVNTTTKSAFKKIRQLYRKGASIL